MNNLKYIPLSSIIASVRNDFSSMDNHGFIDESRIIKIVALCNEKLGIRIREKKECFLPVRNYRADLPADFWKVVYTCALETNSFGMSNYRDPFNNVVTLEMKEQARQEASLQVITQGCERNCPMQVIKREGTAIIQTYTNLIPLSLSKNSDVYTDQFCFNGKGKYQIDINEETIDLPFREGELYFMYFNNLQNENGELMVPFHPLISNWYEWCIKEKILQDMLFNSDGDVVNKLKYASTEKAKYWLDAVNFVSEPFYKELQQIQKRKELKFYNEYFAIMK